MKYQLKFVPLQQNKAVFYLPLDTESKEDAEKIAFELADVLGAEKIDHSLTLGNVSVYAKTSYEGETIGDNVPITEYRFYVC